MNENSKKYIFIFKASQYIENLINILKRSMRSKYDMTGELQQDQNVVNKAHLIPFKPRIFSIPIDKYVTTLPTGYNTKESHATGLT